MYNLRLHEAMAVVLLTHKNRTAKINDIEKAIAKRKLFRRKDGNSPPSNQIQARAAKYPQLFELVSPGTLRLR